MIRTETLFVEVLQHSKGTRNMGLQSLRELNYVAVSSRFVFVDKDRLPRLERNSREAKRKRVAVNLLDLLKRSKRGKKMINSA